MKVYEGQTIHSIPCIKCKHSMSVRGGKVLKTCPKCGTGNIIKWSYNGQAGDRKVEEPDPEGRTE